MIDGHLESAVLKPGRSADAAAVIVPESFKPEPQKLKLPTAPVRPMIVRREENRPQPAADALAGRTGEGQAWPCPSDGFEESKDISSSAAFP